MVADVDELSTGVVDGDRRSLARAITLVESTRTDHRAHAVELIERLLPATGDSTRLGISGPPGVGKSTFIEAFGLHVIGEGHRVAVLAVDPSSRRSGGSILGDKTRMSELGRHPDAFIRPTPTGGTLGGLARRTREALLLCEAAGFDIVIVETVGVGQSETAVSDLVDLFLLLVAPGGGDDLQGIKRGIMELADLVVVNKADGDLAAAAHRTAADYRNALGLMRPRWDGAAPEVLTASALDQTGIAEVWSAASSLARAAADVGERDRRRAEQARSWMWDELREELLARLLAEPEVAAAVAQIEAEVAAGRQAPAAGADEILRQARVARHRGDSS
ncbi:MAG: methylmalonyl Co-A mutase-associated GTPase MeaB [Acidimicrobiia bacterium]|nr:methylmalonyl Co-A mutase-associated GTPase MeaB [Acidimicrobiia bacterium]